MKSPSPQGQLKIDFNYDDRVERLAKEYELMLIPYVPPGTTRETTRNLAGRLAILAGKRLDGTRSRGRRSYATAATLPPSMMRGCGW